MTRSVYLIPSVFLLLCAAGRAEEPQGLLHNEGDISLTGNIRVDLFGMSSLSGGHVTESDDTQLSPESRKSPWTAAGLSMLVPGAGEFYAESYWKAAAFFAFELTAWTVALINDRKGDDQTELFEGYANAHWDVRRYAQWTIDNASNIKPGIDVMQYQAGGSNSVFDASGNVNWANLNELERELGSWYSHSLPPYGEQQYYELIGKYQQYYQGWDDADPSLGTYDAVSAKLATGTTRFTYYSAERGKANDYYSTASTAVTLALVNHVISAVDAAWSASSYNSSIEAGVGFRKARNGPSFVSVPSLTLSYRF
jgi:hypothetical protein